MRHPEPWYRQEKDAWFVQHHGKQVRLAKGKDGKPEAYRAFHKLMAGTRQAPSRLITAAILCDLYLDWPKEEHKPSTQEWYRGHIDSIKKHLGRLEAGLVTPSDASRWLSARKKLAQQAKRPFGTSSRRAAITAIKAIWSWGEKNAHIEKNGIRALERPPMRRRRALTAEEMKASFEAVPDQPFRDFLRALRLTGARPGEVASVTAAMVKEDIWVLAVHKTDGTGEDRVIYLNEEMQASTGRRAKLFPEGPIFRQHRGGRPWNRNAIRCRFRRLRQKLDLEPGVVAYGFRHAFVTDALERGVPVATVAQLVGHRDLKMIQFANNHLREK